MQMGSQRKRKRGNARQRSSHGQKAVGDEKAAWSMSVDHKVQADGVLDGLWQESGHCFDDLGEDAQPILQMALRWPKNEFLASESFGVEEHMLSTASGGENTEASTLSSAGAPATKRTRRNIDSEAVEDLIDIARLMGSRGRYAMDVWEEHDFLERLRSGDGTQRLRWGGGKKWTAAAAAAQRAALMKRRRQFADLGEAVADWTTLAPTYSDDQFIDSQEHQYRAEGSGVYWWSSSASSVAAAKLASSTATADMNGPMKATQPPVPAEYHHPAAWGMGPRVRDPNDLGNSATLHPAAVAPACIRATVLAHKRRRAPVRMVAPSHSLAESSPRNHRKQKYGTGGDVSGGEGGCPLVACPGGAHGGLHTDALLRSADGGNRCRKRKSSGGHRCSAHGSVVADDDEVCEEVRRIVARLRPLQRLNEERIQRLLKLSQLHRSLQPLWRELKDAQVAVEQLYSQHTSGQTTILPKNQVPLTRPEGDFRSNLAIGDQVDAFDHDGVWSSGVIAQLQCDNNELLRHVKVRYVEWGAEYDEWFSVHSDRLAPPGSFVAPGSWQQRAADQE